MVNIKLKINKKEYTFDIPDDLRLIDLLRNKLNLTGTKEGCGEGECGACTILMNGKAVNSCLILALQADKSDITTIEGVGNNEELHPIQQSFIENGAVQCGYCIPGMVLAAKALLDENNNPSKEEIKESISGNLCRCTGYDKIIKSIEQAAFKIKKGSDL